jgi:hypothetical protein
MKSLAAVWSSWLAVAALAGTITVEPDDFPPGADLGSAVPGVVLSTVNTATGNADVTALAPSQANWAATGALVFGHAAPYQAHWVVDTEPVFSYGALRADFLPLATMVSLDFVGNDSSDYGILRAYDAAGMLVEQVETGLLQSGMIETLGVEHPAGIAYVIAGGREADTVCLDHLSFMPIPEPAGFFLMAGVTLALSRRRAR